MQQKMSFAHFHLEQSSDGTNDTSDTEAAESKCSDTTAGVVTGRGGGGRRGPGGAVEVGSQLPRPNAAPQGLTFPIHRKSLQDFP